MRLTHIFKSILLVSLLLVLSNCGIIRDYSTPEVSSTIEENLFRDQIAQDSASIADLKWGELFTDPNLNTLIEEGLSANSDIQIALLRVASASSIFKQKKQDFLPSVEFNPSVTLNNQSRAAINLPPNIDINLRTTTVRLPIGASWEADIWGKIASAKRSALADYLQSDATARATQTQIIATIASSYYQLLALDKQLQITEETVLLREKNLETLEAMKDADLTDGATIFQAEASLYAAKISLPDLKQSIRELENSLSVLLGRVPGPIVRSSIDEQTVYTDIKAGLPLHIIKNRPDVEAAEMAYRSNFEQVNVARASFYPSLTLSAEGGIAAITTNPLFGNSFFTTLAGGLLQPIYQRGMNKRNLRVAEAQQEQDRIAFQQSILDAGQEVSDALFAYEMSTEKEEIRVKQVESLGNSVEATKALLEFSTTTNYLDVISAEQSLLSAQLGEVNDRLQRLLAIVNLYQALGGGWN